MAVVVEGHSVVVRNSTVAGKYPGGMEAYERDCPNRTFCRDGHLCRVGFMVPGDAEVFVAELAARGLTPTRDGVAEDVAVIGRPGGFARPCSWLRLGEREGAAVAWLAGTEPGELHAPPGWAPRRMRYVTAEEARRRLELVRSDGAVDVYRDRATGEELYVGRTRAPSPDDRARHDEMYRQACDLIKGLILLDDLTPEPLRPYERLKLGRAVELFTEVVGINPKNWAAMWLLGKVYQRLEDYESGLSWFSRAHRVNPDQVDVAREASIAAMDAGKPEEAIPFCRRALQVKPGDPGLHANLALALLFCGRPDDAHAVASEALGRDPGDQITKNLVAVIDQVRAGARPCPRHVRDLE